MGYGFRDSRFKSAGACKKGEVRSRIIASMKVSQHTRNAMTVVAVLIAATLSGSVARAQPITLATGIGDISLTYVGGPAPVLPEFVPFGGQ
jgi:hypothetical protein